MKLLGLDKNTLNYTTVWIFKIFDRNTRYHKTELFASRIVTWSYNCLLRISIILLYSHNHEQLYIHICMQKHNDAIKASGHSSLGKYTSHFIGRVVCKRELETEQRLQHIDPTTLLAITAFLSRFPELLSREPGGPGPSLCWDMVLISASYLQLIWTSCRRGYIIIWRPPTSFKSHNFALNSIPRQSRSPLISWYLRPDAPVIYTGAFLLLTAWPGRRSICNNLLKL